MNAVSKLLEAWINFNVIINILSFKIQLGTYKRSIFKRKQYNYK